MSTLAIIGGSTYTVTAADAAHLTALVQRLDVDTVITTGVLAPNSLLRVQPSVITTPTPGVATWVYRWCQESIPCVVEAVHWDLYSRGAGAVCAEIVMSYADALLLFPGRASEIGHFFREAKRQGKSIHTTDPRIEAVLTQERHQ